MQSSLGQDGRGHVVAPWRANFGEPVSLVSVHFDSLLELLRLINGQPELMPGGFKILLRSASFALVKLSSVCGQSQQVTIGGRADLCAPNHYARAHQHHYHHPRLGDERLTERGAHRGRAACASPAPARPWLAQVHPLAKTGRSDMLFGQRHSQS